MLSCYIKFYADTPAGDKNKYFCFKLKSILSLKEAVMRFYDKKFIIRSCYYHELNQDTGEFTNQRIPQVTMDQIFEEWCKLSTKHR